MPEPAKKQSKSKFTFYNYISHGFQLVLAVVILGFLGNYLDQLLKISFPIFLLLGIIVGLIVSIMKLLRQLNDKKH